MSTTPHMVSKAAEAQTTSLCRRSHAILLLPIPNQKKRASLRRPSAPTYPHIDSSTHPSSSPSNEWQDNVVRMLNAAAGSQRTGRQSIPASRASPPIVPNQPSRSFSRPDHIAIRDDSISPGRRLRRRIDDGDLAYSSAPPSATVPSKHFGIPSPQEMSSSQRLGGIHSARSISPALSEDGDSDPEAISGAVGQLSLNEEEEVRYHGKVSGLYMLDSQDRRDSRNEAGIWCVGL